VDHPVRAARWSVSVQRQRGNSFDARMRRKHGRTWRDDASISRGRIRAHALTTITLGAAIAAIAARRTRVALPLAAAWLGQTLLFAAERIRSGPRTPDEVAKMAVTSAMIPPAAVYHRLRGEIRQLRAPRRADRVVDAVLVDRDGTIIADAPYNGDPARVVEINEARQALDRLREKGIAVGVVSNQSGIGRGLLTTEQVERVNAEVEAQLGPFAGWWYCPHDETARCACRKPEPGLLLQALRELNVASSRCAVVGDTAADIGAAHALGMRAILLPNSATRPDEVDEAPLVARDLVHAVDLLLAP
jgi:histidinol-phosphate phosphatase family protein